jgi:ABC-type transport system substrate-binding protein
MSVAFLCACNKTEPETIPETTETLEETTAEAKKERKIILGYFKGKSLNPYKTESPLNRKLLTLCYDSLYLSAENYTVTPLIASSAEREGRKLTVILNQELYFSDGSEIDSSDVVYSFNLAKNDSFYKKRLTNFAAATASASSVVFTMEKEDIFAENCLTFPIIKAGTGGEKYPVGSGRYVIKEKNGELSLKANENTSRKEEMTTKNISLVPVSAVPP